jgi:hypothetical protein
MCTEPNVTPWSDAKPFFVDFGRSGSAEFAGSGSVSRTQIRIQVIK